MTEDALRASIGVHDDVLADVRAFRMQVLATPFQSIPIGDAVFHGIADPPAHELVWWLQQQYPWLTTTLTFARRSPAGQVEPNRIHDDSSMGTWTALLYLNPTPPPEDGTVFWKHRATGRLQASADGSEQADWHTAERWAPWMRVTAACNRLVIFPARCFHSRAIAANYGDGVDARLVLVAFGTGELTRRI